AQPSTDPRMVGPTFWSPAAQPATPPPARPTTDPITPHVTGPADCRVAHELNRQAVRARATTRVALTDRSSAVSGPGRARLRRLHTICGGAEKPKKTRGRGFPPRLRSRRPPAAAPP